MKHKMLNQIISTRNRQRGATLIEALVSILLLSLGLLGMASLQLNALSYQKSSWASHKVSEVTVDITERMRANPIATKEGKYNYEQNYTLASTATLTGNGCRNSTSTTACTPEQIAQDDMRTWLTKAQQLLPGGAATISGESTTGFVITTMYFDKEFKDPITSTPTASTTCVSASTGIAWRNCCPATVAAPAGVRCSRSPLFVYAPD